jgi:hypothetical protein
MFTKTRFSGTRLAHDRSFLGDMPLVDDLFSTDFTSYTPSRLTDGNSEQHDE